MTKLIYLNLSLTVALMVLGVANYSWGTEVVYKAHFERLGAIITAYSSEESQTDSTPRLTASQKEVQKGFIACPRKYPFGTRVEIAGTTYTCEDRKNIRYESYPEEWFDIWFLDTTSAINFGLKRMNVLILSNGY